MDYEILESFYVDAASCEKVRALQSPEHIACICSFIDRLRGYGIRHSHINVEDYDIFTHRELATTIEDFISQAPGTAPPLERITVVERVSRGSCIDDFDRIVRSLSACAGEMARFAATYNIEVCLDMYVQDFDSERAETIARFAGNGALDSLAFFYDHAPGFERSWAGMTSNIAEFCASPVMKNDKIKLGNFPFCCVPADSFKYLYRFPAGSLKGHIGRQRELLADLACRQFIYQEPCRDCRCRAPCYAWTSIENAPGCAALVSPRTQDTLVFAGGSLRAEEYADLADIVFTTPAEQGDMLAAILEGYTNILVIDGYFYTRFPCTTFEAMLALENGLNVFGAASIGALRAVELQDYGMTGLGYVYNYLRKRDIKPYHVVAQTYDECDRPLTCPPIQVIYFLESALAAAVINSAEFERCADAVHRMRFETLSLDNFFRQLDAADTVPAETISRLARYLADNDAEDFDVKTKDADQLMHQFGAMIISRPRDYVQQTFASARDKYLGRLYGKYRQHHDLTLGDNCLLSATGDGHACVSSVTRDSRDAPAAETCRRAGEFFSDLGVTVADTTRYDPADNFILSVFFPHFYFLDYYLSSATGNGEVFEESLASAYMELLERIPTCGFQLNSLNADEINETPFPAADIPQYYNWSAESGFKDSVMAEHGYVRATEILSGEGVLVPKFAVMSRYSGSDGNAAGNSLPEAILYGLYELVERDTSQVHLLAPRCREALSRFLVDNADLTEPRCRTLLDQFEEKSCRIALFNLPNVYDLPCVACRVYDATRRIECHGATAVRADFLSAVYAALSEAYMQYITYFTGARDDYHSLVTAKSAQLAYENAQRTFFDQHASGAGSSPSAATPGFIGVTEELCHVIDRITSVGIKRIIVADTSPAGDYALKSVKVIIPGMELWFCPGYTPSPSFEQKAAATVARFNPGGTDD